MPEGMPDRVSEDMPEDMPDGVPKDMPEHIAKDMPGRMPEDMPDKMPEDIPGKMPEDLPVTKRIDVMVGITRSKVILRRTLRRPSREKTSKACVFLYTLSAGLAISWSQYDVSIGFGHANQQNSKVQTTSSV